MDLGGEDLGVARLLLYDEDGNKDDGHNDGRERSKESFSWTLCVLQVLRTNSTQNLLRTVPKWPAEFTKAVNTYAES